jgi:hypothetical protein
MSPLKVNLDDFFFILISNSFGFDTLNVSVIGIFSLQSSASISAKTFPFASRQLEPSPALHWILIPVTISLSPFPFLHVLGFFFAEETQRTDDRRITALPRCMLNVEV